MSFRLQIIAYSILMTLTLIAGRHLSLQGKSLRETMANCVVGLELAWSSSRAQAYVDALGPQGLAVARTNVLLDFAFLRLYPFSISLVCALVGWVGGGKFSLWCSVLAWAVLAAMPLDAIENAALLIILQGQAYSP